MRHLPRTIHMAGIGGAGMSGLAELLATYGHRVTGSDSVRSKVTARLEDLGIPVQYDHEPSLVKSADLLIYSSAVREENPERAYAAAHGIEQLRRADALGQVMRGFTALCVAGTHGKTTTTSLAGAITSEGGMQPTVLVGGTLRAQGAPVVIGKGDLMVVEADEYDRSFLALSPTVALVTNIEADHLDCYASLDAIYDAFVSFIAFVPFFGAVVCCIDDEGVRAIMPRIRRRTVTYGTGERAADYQARDIRLAKGKPSFEVVRRGELLGRASITIPGLHNVRNALGAAAASMEMGVSFDAVAAALCGFTGIRRRFEILGAGEVTVIDDYAHHPAEVAATLLAARQGGFSSVTAVFQPHLYSRTRDFLGDFAAALSKADRVLVTGIYKAREEAIPGVTAEAIVEKMRCSGFAKAQYVARKEDVVGAVLPNVKKGDAVVVMGAGDITETAHLLAEALRG